MHIAAANSYGKQEPNAASHMGTQPDGGRGRLLLLTMTPELGYTYQPRTGCSGVRACASNRQMGWFRTMTHQGSKNAEAERVLLCCRIYCYVMN